MRCSTGCRVFFRSFAVAPCPSLRTVRLLCRIFGRWGETHSATLNSVAQSILRLYGLHQIRLVPQFIPGKLNVLADSESSLPSPRLGMDLVSSALPGASSSMACDHRLLRDLDECSFSGVVCSDGGSSVSGHGRHDAVVGWHAGVCLPSLRPSASCAVGGSAVQGSGTHPCSSVLASAPLVSRPSGASGGCPSVPSTAEGSTQTAALPSLSPEPPRASADYVSYIERSARAFGSTSVVAHQLASCRRHSTRVNYQANGVCLLCLASSSSALCVSPYDSEDCLFSSLPLPFLVSLVFFYCFLLLCAEPCLPLRSSRSFHSLCSS